MRRVDASSSSTKVLDLSKGSASVSGPGSAACADAQADADDETYVMEGQDPPAGELQQPPTELELFGPD